MTVTELRYFRVTCDGEGCKAYINVAAADTNHLASVLKMHKWLVDTDVHESGEPVFACPAHKEEG